MLDPLAPFNFTPSRLAARSRNTISFLRYLFPHTHQRARSRLFDFRHETVPYYRQRAQSRIYRFILDGQRRRVHKRTAGKGIWALLRKSSRPSINRPRDVVHRRSNMTQPVPSGTPTTGGDYGPESRERGARRRKLAGYLRAANELRQSYQQNYVGGQKDPEPDEDESGIPGAFPDVSIVRNSDEEMVLFPSYARRHGKRWGSREAFEKHKAKVSSSQDGSQNVDADYWRRQWEQNLHDDAIVDVDVRGWLYSPHRGPMTRKNRLMIGLARHLSGVPAPSGDAQSSTSSASDTGSGHAPSPRGSLQNKAARHEEELVAQQAESIMKQGEGEADIAQRGGYSENPDQGDGRGWSPTPRPGQHSTHTNRPPHLRNSSVDSATSSQSSPTSLSKKASWNQPADMSAAELSIANAHLMARLKPFLTNPLVSTPITAFFYNDQTSQSRSIMTDESGHFHTRAALNFIPTNVRVLASERLSATETVTITEPKGVSLISDIDDTIKHSAVGSGAKEIFRNTFIRELSDLTIPGVTEWYERLARMGVKMHYVSNSPWQLYPLLVSYFSAAGLPSGSYHLKQYSGMLQGIFEPVAERKKGTLERILNDFPERKFLLVGDSGEADLEVYTDIVCANPGRVIGVFIRDITSPPSQGFFDSSVGPWNGDKSMTDNAANGTPGGRSNDTTSAHRKAANPPEAPSLPRRSQHSGNGPHMGRLIDVDNDEESIQEPTISRNFTHSPVAQVDDPIKCARDTKSNPPARPAKPAALRSSSSHSLPMSSDRAYETPGSPRKSPPPIPPKPRRYSSSNSPAPKEDKSAVHRSQGPPTADSRQRYMPNVRQKVAGAYNMLPSTSSVLSREARPAAPSSTRSSVDRTGLTSALPPPPAQPRRNLTSYPAAAAQYASSRLGTNWSSSGANNSADPNTQVGNKKEELWKRRWARAKQILEDKGVVLKSWRVGDDAMKDAVKLVEKTLKKANDEGN
ncbi:MAG: hypothetical protein M1833_007200 [Piccolia ochrophora]|nr:MAG: hypothetical protein M1833_007200 [Piccolia ochrophora]